jgi:hypothetical protein
MGTVQESKRRQLEKPIRDPNGGLQFHETSESQRKVNNLGRRTLPVRFDDGATTFLFPHEVVAAELSKCGGHIYGIRTIEFL